MSSSVYLRQDLDQGHRDLKSGKTWNPEWVLYHGSSDLGSPSVALSSLNRRPVKDHLAFNGFLGFMWDREKQFHCWQCNKYIHKVHGRVHTGE